MFNPTDDTHLQASERGARPRRVLIIDDEPHIREAIEAILELSGVDTVSASGGRSGVRHLRENPAYFGLIFLDLSMPGMSGEETLTALRAVDDEIPIVILSGHANLQSDSGADFQGYLRKPFSTESLLRLLEHFF